MFVSTSEKILRCSNRRSSSFYDIYELNSSNFVWRYQHQLSTSTQYLNNWGNIYVFNLLVDFYAKRKKITQSSKNIHKNKQNFSRLSNEENNIWKLIYVEEWKSTYNVYNGVGKLMVCSLAAIMRIKFRTNEKSSVDIVETRRSTPYCQISPFENNLFIEMKNVAECFVKSAENTAIYII